jgi:undecaprenyl-diphosphatase
MAVKPAGGAEPDRAGQGADGGGTVQHGPTGVRRELEAVDVAVYSAIAATPTPTLDRPLRLLSDAADNSRLWLLIAAGLAVAGGRPGRRAAARGMVAVGATSALVNLAVKSAWSRRRPDPAGAGVPEARNVKMPGSPSFPSGHAASAFAFAEAASRELPWLGGPLRFLAAAVAYSRVHAGVHYPGDVIIGALIGEATGQAVAGVLSEWHRPGTATSVTNELNIHP